MSLQKKSKQPKSRPCDRCRLKKRKCDGLQPCSTCKRCRTGDAVCTYTDQPKKEQEDASLFRLQYLENVLSSIVPNTNSSIIHSRIQTPEYTQDLFQGLPINPNSFDYPFVIPTPLDHYNQTVESYTPTQRSTQVEDDLETHLIRISFLYYTGYTVRRDLRPVELCQRDTPLSFHLRKAICFHSTFLSTHPDLFTGKTQIGFEDRLQAAQNYVIDPTSIANQMNGSDNQLICDDIRAIFVYCMAQFSLGNAIGALDMVNKAVQLMKQFGILNKRALEDQTSACVTLDDFVTMDSASQPLVILTEQEKCERLSLLAMLLGIDTFGSIASGTGFIIDEGEFPECGFPIGSLDLFSKQEGPRVVAPDLAQNTIWENTAYAPMVDDIREVCFNIFKGNANGTLEAQFELLLLRLIRRIIRYSRDQKFAKNTGQDRFVQMILHNSMLQYLAYSPSQVVCFNSFKPYLYGSDGQLTGIEKYPSDALMDNSLVFLNAFAYLHFSTAMNNDDTKFSLDMGGQCIYSSRDIIFSLLKILSLMIQYANKPLLPQESTFGPYPYPADKIKLALENQANIAPPLFCTPLFTLLSFVVASAAVSVFQRENSPQAQEVYRMTKDIVIPAMLKVDQLWPSSENYSSKLKNMVSNFI